MAAGSGRGPSGPLRSVQPSRQTIYADTEIGRADNPPVLVELCSYYGHGDASRLRAEIEIEWDGAKVKVIVRRIEDDPTVEVLLA